MKIEYHTMFLHKGPTIRYLYTMVKLTNGKTKEQLIDEFKIELLNKNIPDPDEFDAKSYSVHSDNLHIRATFHSKERTEIQLLVLKDLLKQFF